MELFKVKLLYQDTQVSLIIHFPELAEENCLSWVPPFQNLLEISNIQSQVLEVVTETSLDITSHNSVSLLKFAEISAKIEKYPDLIRNIYEDLSAIHKSVHRMKKKLALPAYRPSED